MEVKLINGVKTYFISSYKDYQIFLQDIKNESAIPESKSIKIVFEKDVKFGSFMEENHFIEVFNRYVLSQMEIFGVNVEIEVLLKNDLNASTVNRAELISEPVGKLINSAISSKNVKVDCVFEREDGERVSIDGKYFAISQKGSFVETLGDEKSKQEYRMFVDKIQPEVLEVKCESIDDVFNTMQNLESYGRKFQFKVNLKNNDFDVEFFDALSSLIKKAKQVDVEFDIVIDASSMKIDVDTVKRFSALKEQSNYSGVDVVYSGEEGDIYTSDELLSAMAKGRLIVDKIKNSNASPFEKYLMIYRYVSSRPYVLNEETPGRTRDLISVLNGDDIVCAGYANLLKWLCDEVGIKCEIQTVKCVQNDGSVTWHANNRVFLEDSKYDIHGWYFSDATLDSPEKFSGAETDKHYMHCLVPVTDVKYMTGSTDYYSNGIGSLGMFYKIPDDLVGLYTENLADVSYYIGTDMAKRIEQPQTKKLSETEALGLIDEAYGVIEKIMLKNSIGPYIFEIDKYNYRNFSSLSRERFFGGINKYILLYLSGCFSEEELAQIMIKAENSEMGQKLKEEYLLEKERKINSDIRMYDMHTKGIEDNAEEDIELIEEEIARLEEENASEEQIFELKIEIERIRKDAAQKKASRIANRDAEIEKIKARHLFASELPQKQSVIKTLKDFMVNNYYNWVEVNQEMEQERRNSKVIPLDVFSKAIIESYVAEGFSEEKAREMVETEIEETKYVAQYVYDVGAVNCFVSDGSGGVLTSVANVNG